MLYFAYGSNMNWDRMKDRCSSACFVGIATLEGYKLAFTRKDRGFSRHRSGNHTPA